MSFFTEPSFQELLSVISNSRHPNRIVRIVELFNRISPLSRYRDVAQKVRELATDSMDSSTSERDRSPPNHDREIKRARTDTVNTMELNPPPIGTSLESSAVGDFSDISKEDVDLVRKILADPEGDYGGFDLSLFDPLSPGSLDQLGSALAALGATPEAVALRPTELTPASTSTSDGDDYVIPSEPVQETRLKGSAQRTTWKFWMKHRAVSQLDRQGVGELLKAFSVKEGLGTRTKLAEAFFGSRSENALRTMLSTLRKDYDSICRFHEYLHRHKLGSFDYGLPKTELLQCVGERIRSFQAADGGDFKMSAEEYYAWTFDQSKGLFALMHKELGDDQSTRRARGTPASGSATLPYIGNLDYREVRPIDGGDGRSLSDHGSGPHSHSFRLITPPISAQNFDRRPSTSASTTSAPLGRGCGPGTNPDLHELQNLDLEQGRSEMLRCYLLYEKAAEAAKEILSNERAIFDGLLRLLNTPNVDTATITLANERLRAYIIANPLDPEQYQKHVAQQMPLVEANISRAQGFDNARPSQSRPHSLIRAIHSPRVRTFSPLPQAVSSSSSAPANDRIDGSTSSLNA